MPPSHGPSSQLSSSFLPLAQPRVLVTAGPTHEPLDAVRYLGNRSSGRMGIALARAASRRGWPTTLLLGPASVPPPDAVATHRFQTTADLQTLLEHQWADHDLLIMAAAVADFVPERISTGKMPRGEAVQMTLRSTPDLVAGLAARRSARQRIVGFALEAAEDLPAKADAKRTRKGLDAIVANPLTTMESDRIDGMLLLPDQPPRTPGTPLPKPAFADWLLDQLVPPGECGES